ncbi:hypothetical protein EVAR_15955_1 [Eumeta japonica]|uniref:Uncharacterized protein n=1 Tax=Eumeta variegata TaxID=151549 RepID=A0A4C1UMG7_EUMVA|nr:hypothetical protein EVAR_15955_1 [Eumeta japonica]
MKLSPDGAGVNREQRAVGGSSIKLFDPRNGAVAKFKAVWRDVSCETLVTSVYAHITSSHQELAASRSTRYRRRTNQNVGSRLDLYIFCIESRHRAEFRFRTKKRDAKTTSKSTPYHLSFGERPFGGFVTQSDARNKQSRIRRIESETKRCRSAKRLTPRYIIEVSLHVEQSMNSLSIQNSFQVEDIDSFRSVMKSRVKNCRRIKVEEDLSSRSQFLL